jgi:hypothetical protein
LDDYFPFGAPETFYHRFSFTLIPFPLNYGEIFKARFQIFQNFACPIRASVVYHYYLDKMFGIINVKTACYGGFNRFFFILARNDKRNRGHVFLAQNIELPLPRRTFVNKRHRYPAKLESGDKYRICKKQRIFPERQSCFRFDYEYARKQYQTRKKQKQIERRKNRGPLVINPPYRRAAVFIYGICSFHDSVCYLPIPL